MRSDRHGTVRASQEAVRVGYYSPLPPARTGVADYADRLLRALREHGEVEVAPAGCDLAIYQVGNNQLHREVYRRAIQQAGVVILHDAVLHHFFLGWLTRAEYVAEFVYNYGEWSRGEAEALWEGRGASGQDPRYFARPMLKRLAETARVVVVHNAAAAAMVRAHSAEAEILEVPHFAEVPEKVERARVEEFRRRAGVREGGMLFGMFGYLRESKRVLPVLRAFRALHARYPLARLLVAGEFVSADLERAAWPLLEGPGIHRIGYLPEAGFAMASLAVDCVVNLRYPAAGETSGIAIRMMALGKPVIFTDGAEIAAFPETACFRIRAGVGEEAELLAYLVLAMEVPEAMRLAGKLAAEYIVRYHSLDTVAAKIWAVLSS